MPKKKPVNRKKKETATGKAKGDRFPIVAIGASAGGLQAVSILLKNLPARTGMAFFYVQHLSPNHPSNLVLLLSKVTKMKVQEASNGLIVKLDNLYVCPPDKDMILSGKKIKLMPRLVGKVPYLPIDGFFSSLAPKHKENLVGIILSGNATDGTRGLQAIKKVGGVTFAQDDTALHKSMPRSAIKEGVVDHILPPDEIARKLMRLRKMNFRNKRVVPKKKKSVINEDDPDFKQVLKILHKETGIDFTHYKMATIKRRMAYRMLHYGASTLKEYSKVLLNNRNESQLLCKDMLIHVTQFFRDAVVFQYLKTTLFPKLLKSKAPGEKLRIWVPACSTGEEAYSIAMVLAELQENKNRKVPVQIFATDLSEEAIREARIGMYSQSDVEQISKTRVKRFFTEAGDQYHINKDLRETCVFAPHNILNDPPFSRMDFISCCNLLIYFDISAQKKALATLGFALNDKGYLRLGKSETIGALAQNFTQVNHKYKIYALKKNNGVRKLPELLPRFSTAHIADKSPKLLSRKNTAANSKELDSVIDSVLLSRYMPACAVINKDMEILQFRGATEPYLAHPSGKASLNILKMIKTDFVFELRTVIHKAIKTKKTATRAGIEMKSGPLPGIVTLAVCPLKIEWDQPLLLVVFTMQEQVEKYIETAKGKKTKAQTRILAQKDKRIKKLYAELSTTRAEMHAVVEAQETAYEELEAANEEIVSANEEFQTLNEELETSKEEIETTNEELIVANQELQTRNDLLNESYKYSEAIIATIHEPMVVLDSKLSVRTANNSFYKKFGVRKEETEGVSLFQLGNKQWDIPQLRKLLNDVLSKGTAFEDYEITHTFSGIGEKIMLLNAHRIVQKTHGEQLILLAIEDITERARYYLREKELLHKDIKGYQADKAELEKAVKYRTRELEQRNKELETFTFVSSHDLQEPLRKIKNFLSVVMSDEKKELPEETKKNLQKTYATAQRMQELIEDLLAYSRLKNGQGKFEKADVSTILHEISSECEEILNEKKAKIIYSRLDSVKVIRFQFRQLFFNLILNSLKFSKPGIDPVIEIKTEIISAGKPGPKKLSARHGYWHLVYSDNGIGFDPQYNERIFEVFQRLNEQEEYKGTGIGLAICKRIVDNHNGIIEATGKPGIGAQFDIYLPLSD